MDDAVVGEAAGNVMFLVGTALVGCLVVLLVLAGLLVYLLVRYQKQATFPMELLLQQNLPGEERIRSAISTGVAAGRISGFPPRPQPNGSTGAGPDAEPTAMLVPASQARHDPLDPLGLGG